jgi:hypothetical protein
MDKFFLLTNTCKELQKEKQLRSCGNLEALPEVRIAASIIINPKEKSLQILGVRASGR